MSRLGHFGAIWRSGLAKNQGEVHPPGWTLRRERTRQAAFSHACAYFNANSFVGRQSETQGLQKAVQSAGISRASRRLQNRLCHR
jgi:hypothetical protein